VKEGEKGKGRAGRLCGVEVEVWNSLELGRKEKIKSRGGRR
jgi:hypothetical protein